MSGKKNGLFFSDWLRKNGYSDQLIRKYRQSGWLATLDKGVMYRTGDSLSSFAALSCYNEQLNKKARVAAHSALELFGFNHYVPMGKPLLMVAHHNSNIPKWMTSDSFDKNFKGRKKLEEFFIDVMGQAGKFEFVWEESKGGNGQTYLCTFDSDSFNQNIAKFGYSSSELKLVCIDESPVQTVPDLDFYHKAECESSIEFYTIVNVLFPLQIIPLFS